MTDPSMARHCVELEQVVTRLRRALAPFAKAGASKSANHNDLHGALSGIALADLWNAATAELFAIDKLER